MGTAALWADRSTCSRLHVGCVVARESRILVTGYNGAPSGMAHCDHECNCGYPGKGGLLFENRHLSSCNSKQPCTISVHAEANAIAFAARHGISLEGAFLYTTHTPCRPCSMLIINAGIIAVVWKEDYMRDDGLELLKAGNVGFGRYKGPSSEADIIIS